MILECIVVLLISGVDSSPVASCVPDQWGPWGQCVTEVDCTTAVAGGIQAQSYSLPQTAAWDSGRDAMTISMQKKKETYSNRVRSMEVPDFHGYHTCVTGMAGHIPCKNILQLSYLTMAEMGYPENVNDTNYMGNDVWGWTDPLTGDEYALLGMSGGTAFVRITNPTNPLTVAFLPTHTRPSIWRDIKTVGNFAYIGSEAAHHGMQVFDLTRLRGRNRFMGSVQVDAHYNKVGNSHNIVANDDTNFIYIVGATSEGNGAYTPCQGGLHAVDVSNPLNPTFAGCYAEDGYTHDAQCVIYNGPDARYFRREVCFAFNEDSLTIVDVTDKSNMQIISKETYGGVQYTHQGWISTDMSLLLLDDELDELGQTDERTKTFMWDISDLRNPVLRHTHYHSFNCIDHNQYIKGSFAYQSNYESGLRIMHIDNVNWRLKEVGYFDVRPDRTTTDWFGTWSVYPYFNSGTVVVSSIDYGMFIVRPDYMAMENEAFSSNTNTVEGMQSRIQETHSEDPSIQCTQNAETRPCVVEC